MENPNLISHISNLISKYVIIVAGGSGTRMQSAVPKQFLLINGLPVLMHTMLAFYNSRAKPDIILVLHADFHAYWNELCTVHNFTLPHLLVAGGELRCMMLFARSPVPQLLKYHTIMPLNMAMP
jgi:2-C-methyl-D-erythritol 4-phosphate cytidylyltransferase